MANWAEKQEVAVTDLEPGQQIKIEAGSHSYLLKVQVSASRIVAIVRWDNLKVSGPPMRLLGAVHPDGPINRRPAEEDMGMIRRGRLMAMEGLQSQGRHNSPEVVTAIKVGPPPSQSVGKAKAS